MPTTVGDISLITLPSGNTYSIKDTVARSTAGGGLQFRGITTTEITDGATTTSYVIGSNTLTAQNADMVVYGTKEFIYTTADNKWHELGDNTSLGQLAYKDSASGTYIGVASVSVTTATSSNQTASVTASAVPNGGTANYTPSGDISFTNTENKTATVSPAATGTATYTPDGTVGTPTISVKTAGTTDTIHNPTSTTVAKTVVAAAPGATAPSNAITYYAYDGNTETLSLYQLGYTTGASITTNDVTVKTGDAAYQSSQPSWTGTGVRLVTGNIPVPSAASFTGDGTMLTTGNISVPATYTATITPENRTVTVS